MPRFSYRALFQGTQSTTKNASGVSVTCHISIVATVRNGLQLSAITSIWSLQQDAQSSDFKTAAGLGLNFGFRLDLDMNLRSSSEVPIPVCVFKIGCHGKMRYTLGASIIMEVVQVGDPSAHIEIPV